MIQNRSLEIINIYKRDMEVKVKFYQILKNQFNTIIDYHDFIINLIISLLINNIIILFNKHKIILYIFDHLSV